MNKISIIIFISVIAIIIFLLFGLKKKEGYKSIRGIISSQDNCASCTTKYTKYAHNIPLNSDGQYIL